MTALSRSKRHWNILYNPRKIKGLGMMEDLPAIVPTIRTTGRMKSKTREITRSEKNPLSSRGLSISYWIYLIPLL